METYKQVVTVNATYYYINKKRVPVDTFHKAIHEQISKGRKPVISPLEITKDNHWIIENTFEEA